MFFKERFDLSQYDADLKDSYILLRMLNKGEVLKYTKATAKLLKGVNDNNAIDFSNELIELMYKTVQDAFIKGEIREEDNLRPATVTDLETFPIPVIKDMLLSMQGNLSKKN